MRPRTCGLLAALLALATGLALAAPASAIVVHEPNGRYLSVTPRAGVNPASIPGSLAARHAQPRTSGPGLLGYGGGPVLHSSAPYLIFWTPSGESTPSASSQALMKQYFADAAANSGGSANVFGVARQYSDAGGFADYRQTFNPASQAIVDTQPFPINGCTDTGAAFPRCLTDAQLQDELARVIVADSLPTGIGPNAPVYFLVTPGDVNICTDSSNSSCATVDFCAYHSVMSTPGGAAVLYASIPFFITGPAGSPQDPKSCQQDSNPPDSTPVQEPNGNLADVAISYTSHEFNEIVTDPAPPTGWVDPSGNEDGDECARITDNGNAFLPTLGGSSGGTLFDQVINGHAYYTQTEWSNGDANCQAAPSPGTLAPAFTVPSPGTAPAGATASFDPAPTNSSRPLSSATWTFDDGGRSVTAGVGTLAPVTHAFATAGRHTVTLTMVDNSGNLATASEQVVIGSSPNAAFTYAPARTLAGGSVSFNAGRSTDPDAGVTLTGYTWSFGDGSSASGAAPRHVYRGAGAFTVTLQVTNSLGLARTVTQRVTVRRGIAAVAVRRTGTVATVVVTVNGPGRVVIAGRTFRLRRAGKAKRRIFLTRPQLTTLAVHHTLRLRVNVTFVPANGRRVSRIVTVKFTG